MIKNVARNVAVWVMETYGKDKAVLSQINADAAVMYNASFLLAGIQPVLY